MKWQRDIRASEKFGVVAYWSNGELGFFRNPSLHHSSTPLLLLLCVAATLIIAGTAHAQTLKRIKIGYPSLSFRQSNVWVAREMGLFAKYGLEVEPIDGGHMVAGRQPCAGYSIPEGSASGAGSRHGQRQGTHL